MKLINTYKSFKSWSSKWFKSFAWFSVCVNQRMEDIKCLY